MYIVTHNNVVHIPNLIDVRVVTNCSLHIGYYDSEDSTEILTRVIDLTSIEVALEAHNKIMLAYSDKSPIVDIRVFQTKKFNYSLNPNEVPLAEEILEFLEDINIVLANNSRFDDDKYPDSLSVTVSTHM
jgi:nicotinamide riboside kinase